jgi:hypothetical protein
MKKITQGLIFDRIGVLSARYCDGGLWPIPEMTAGGRGVRLLGCTCRGDPEAIKQAKADAIKVGYSIAAVGAIGRTPSDVFLFSKLPEADQQAILRQANKDEFERYIGHAHMKLRKPMREERAGKQAETTAPASVPSSAPVAPVPRPATPPPSPRPTPPPPPAQAWPPAQPPTFNDLRMR